MPSRGLAAGSVAITLLASATFFLCQELHSQNPPTHPTDVPPEFDVATVKLSNPNMPGRQFMANGHEFLTINTTLDDLITFAYGIHVRQIVGAPAWAASVKYDLDGKYAGQNQPDDRQWKMMIQGLLQDRFNLTFHHAANEVPVYELTVARNGPRLTQSKAEPNSLPGMGFRGFGNMPVSNATMADFAAMLQGSVLDRPVLDRTGLRERFDFVLKWTPDDSQFIGMRLPGMPTLGNDSVDAPPNIFTAMQEQLGLKLQAAKAPVSVMVIDHLDKPAPN